jgi:hypothetical protein
MVNAVHWGDAVAADHPLVVKPGLAEKWLGFLPQGAFLGRVGTTAHGSGGPGKAALSNTDEMPSVMVCSPRDSPKPGPAMIRTA